MFLDEEKFTDIIVKYKLNANQMFYMYLIHTGSSSVYRIAEEGKKFYKKDVDELEELGFIKNLNKTMSAHQDNYVINENTQNGKEFLEYINSDITMGDELWSIYPWNFESNGKSYPTKACDKDMISDIYTKKIKGSMKLHREIIKLVKRANSYNLISMGIEKFVNGEQWNYLKRRIETLSEIKVYGENEFE